MPRYPYAKAVRPGKLADEIMAAVPACAPEVLPDGARRSRLHVWREGTGSVVEAPDSVDEPTIAALVAAHNASAPSQADQGQADRDAKLATLRTSYQTLLNRAGTIHTQMGATKATTGTRTGAQLSADVRLIASAVDDLTTGVERLLEVVRVLVRNELGD